MKIVYTEEQKATVRSLYIEGLLLDEIEQRTKVKKGTIVQMTADLPRRPPGRRKSESPHSTEAPTARALPFQAPTFRPDRVALDKSVPSECFNVNALECWITGGVNRRGTKSLPGRSSSAGAGV